MKMRRGEGLPYDLKTHEVERVVVHFKRHNSLKYFKRHNSFNFCTSCAPQLVQKRSSHRCAQAKGNLEERPKHGPMKTPLPDTGGHTSEVQSTAWSMVAR